MTTILRTEKSLPLHLDYDRCCHFIIKPDYFFDTKVWQRSRTQHTLKQFKKSAITQRRLTIHN